MMARTTIGVVIFGWAVLMAASVEAQFPRYQSQYRSPYGPPISPHMDFFRFDDATLGNYNGIVQRNDRVRQDLYQQRVRLNRQAAQFRGFQNQSNSAVAPTGSGGRFFDYSHYYQLRRQTR